MRESVSSFPPLRREVEKSSKGEKGYFLIHRDEEEYVRA